MLVLGAGGAARGILVPLLDENAALARDLPTARWRRRDALAAAFARAGRVAAVAPDALAGRTFDVVINATSAGLSGDVDAGRGPTGLFARGAFAYDMIYARRRRRRSCAGRARKALRAAADGLGMLVEQAAESFFLWRGVRPDTRAGVRAAAAAA